MHCEFDIPDNLIPSAVDPVFQHVVQTYASETNKTVTMWRAILTTCWISPAENKSRSNEPGSPVAWLPVLPVLALGCR